jgi:hypothetical protein
MKTFLIKLLIKWIERDLDYSREILTEEQRNGLFSTLFDNPAFRNYIKERDEKLIWTIAGGAGLAPEPRDKYAQKFGQRVEILLLASKAKACWVKRGKDLEQKKLEEQKKNDTGQ